MNSVSDRFRTVLRGSNGFSDRFVRIEDRAGKKNTSKKFAGRRPANFLRVRLRRPRPNERTKNRTKNKKIRFSSANFNDKSLCLYEICVALMKCTPDLPEIRLRLLGIKAICNTFLSKYISIFLPRRAAPRRNARVRRSREIWVAVWWPKFWTKFWPKFGSLFGGRNFGRNLDRRVVAKILAEIRYILRRNVLRIAVRP